MGTNLSCVTVVAIKDTNLTPVTPRDINLNEGVRDLVAFGA